MDVCIDARVLVLIEEVSDVKINIYTYLNVAKLTVSGAKLVSTSKSKIDWVETAFDPLLPIAADSFLECVEADFLSIRICRETRVNSLQLALLTANNTLK